MKLNHLVVLIISLTTMLAGCGGTDALHLSSSPNSTEKSIDEPVVPIQQSGDNEDASAEPAENQETSAEVPIMSPWTTLPVPTPDESVQTKQLLDLGTGAKAGAGDFRSPITTINGTSFYVWVDSELTAWVGKRDAQGYTTKTTLLSGVTNDDYHTGFSLGIDREGYIHVAGNMHHTPYGGSGTPTTDSAWWYWVSKSPYDISSFDFVGDKFPERTIPGTSITYPSFSRDRNGELYVSFRHRVQFAGFKPGSLAFAIAKYNPDNKSWKMLGGRDYPYGYNTDSQGGSMMAGTTFYWDDSGYNETAYQGYRGQIFFDKNNRLHVVWGGNNGTISENANSEIYYAYSDDGGDTFFRADGVRYDTLPLTSATADVAFRLSQFSNTKSLWYRPRVGVDPNGYPVVSTSLDTSDEAYYTKYVPGPGWSTPKKLPASFTAPFYTDQCGVMTAIAYDTLSRSTDGGETWKKHTELPFPDTTSGFDVSIDSQYLADTSHLRLFIYFPESIAIYDTEFSGLVTECNAE